jgi:Nuclease-related domain
MGAHVAQRTPRARFNLAALTQRGRPRGSDPVEEPDAPLDLLGRAWHRIDEVRWPGQSFANVDHVVVGPAGVFVIDKQPYRDSLAAELATARQDGPAKTPFRGLAAAAHAIGTLLGMVDPRPSPVLLVVGGKEMNTVAGQIVVLSPSNVVDYLLAQPAVYEREEVSLLASRLRSRLVPATGSVDEVPTQRSR